MTSPLDRIRVGFTVEATVQAAWIARAIHLVLALPWAEVPLIVVTGRRVSGPPVLEPARGLYDTFSAHELRRLPTEFGDPYEAVDLSRDPLIPSANIRALQRDPMAPRGDEDITVAECEEAGLDVLVCTTAAGVPRELLASPRFGAWGFEGGTDRRRSTLQAFWNVMNRSPQTNVELYRLSHAGSIAGTVLSAPSRTILGSPLITEVCSRWKAPSLVAQALTHLRLRGAVPGADATAPHPPDPPASKQMAWLWGRHTLRLIRLRLLAEIARPQWFVHYHFNNHDGPEGSEPALDFRRFQSIDTPADRVWADPFPVHRDGRHFVFFEEKLDSEEYGHISVMELAPSGPASPPRTVLSRPHHLSYPFLFDWEGETFMMPESHDVGRLEVYRAVRFPDQWEFVSVVLPKALADATLAEIEGTWWLFAAQQSAPILDCDELVIYHAPTPLGPWTAHAANPVLSDVRSARPAGRVFRAANGWIRPVQDGLRGYGHSMRLMRILKLTPSEFEEEVVRELAPNWARGLHGTHTLNSAAGLTTIDAVRLIRRHRPRRAPDGAPSGAPGLRDA